MLAKVCIDPGHGGRDPGAIGPSGVQEKVITLAVAVQVAGILSPVAEVKLTRDTDIALGADQNADLVARANKANEWPADVFVSIHCNSAVNRTAHGCEVWTSPGQTGGDILAESIIKSMETALPELTFRKDFSDGDSDKEAAFAVLTKTNMPACLVELAFISNPTEEAMLESPAFQAKTARAIAEGIAGYLNIKLIKEDKPVDFKDLDKCWYPDLAQEAIKRGVIAQPTDGMLRPRDAISREEVWLMLLRMDAMKDFDAQVPDLVQECMKSVVRIWNNGSIGSGSFIAPNIILTASHVVVGAVGEISIDTHDNEIKGKVIKCGSMETIDLALIKVDGEYPFLPLADGIIQGEPCLALGNPLGEFETVSAGIVTKIAGDFVQVDANVNPGNSGGAIVNAKGELIGVPSWKVNQAAVDNHNYSVQLTKIREFIRGMV